MARILIELPGPPRGKARPRRAPNGKHVYSDRESERYETQLKFAAKLAMNGNPPLEGPVAAALCAMMPIPGSWSKKRREQALSGELLPTTRPDLDNVLKHLDGLNGIVFADDRQVVRATAAKVYGVAPGLAIIVEPLGYDEGG